MIQLTFSIKYFLVIIMGLFLCHAQGMSSSFVLSKTEREFFIKVQDGDFKDVQRAVSNGMAVNAINARGSSILHYAAEYKNRAVAKFLLSKGAHVNLKNNQGLTPLHKAVYDKTIQRESKALRLVELLLQAGADCTSADTRGYTPLDFALEGTYGSIVQFLLKFHTSKLLAVPEAAQQSEPEPPKEDECSDNSLQFSEEVFPEFSFHSVESPKSRALFYEALKKNDFSVAKRIIVWMTLTRLDEERKVEAYATIKKLLPGSIALFKQAFPVFGEYSFIDRLCFIDVWREALMIIFFDELRNGLLRETSVVADAQDYANRFLAVRAEKILAELKLKITKEKPSLAYLEGESFFTPKNISDEFKAIIEGEISSKLLRNSLASHDSPNTSLRIFENIQVLATTYSQKVSQEKKRKLI